MFIVYLCVLICFFFVRFFSDSIRNNIIPEEGVIGDLMAINIVRARERGVPGYNQFREWCRVGKATSFGGFANTIDREGQRILSEAYKSVDDVDLFVGGIFEAPFNGGGLGATFTCILGNAFKALRLGDRFWYETDQRETRFTLGQLETLRNTTLARIICENSDGIREIQPRVLLRRFVSLPDGSQNNPYTKCEDLPLVNLNEWKRLVQSVFLCLLHIFSFFVCLSASLSVMSVCTVRLVVRSICISPKVLFRSL